MFDAYGRLRLIDFLNFMKMGLETKLKALCKTDESLKEIFIRTGKVIRR